MSTLTVYSSAADGSVESSSATYATARSTAFVAYSIYSPCNLGQNAGYACWEVSLGFDTASLPDAATVSSAPFYLFTSGDFSATDFIAEARLHNWGATLTTADWIAGASLGNLTLLATFNTAGISGARYETFTDVAMPANINKTGVTSLMVSSSRQRVGNQPTGAEYWQVYVSEAAGTDYDPKLVVTYAVLPTVTTTAITAITSTTATSGGNVTDDGGATITDRGICWNTAGTPTVADSHTHDADGTGEFASSLTGLSAGTTYHVRAWATNSVGTSYGAEVDFTTPHAPVVTTTAITAITTSTATSGGNVTDEGDLTCTRGVCWNTGGTPTTADSKTTDAGSSGVYVSYLTSLSPGTSYHVRAWATNDVGTSYGAEVDFTTPQDSYPSIPEVALTDAQILTLITAGNLSVDFGAELLSASDVLMEDISADLLGGEVEHQNYADVHGTCSIQLSRALTWATARVRLSQTLTGAGLTKTWYLGVYLLTTPQTPLGETPVTMTVAGADKLHLLQKPVGDTYVVATGTGYLAAVRAAITASGDTGPAPLLDGTQEAAVLPAPMVWILDPADLTSYLRVINDLLAVVGYRGLYADRNGRYCSEPYHNPVDRPSVWTLDLSDAHTCIVGEYRTLTTDEWDGTNFWRFVRTGMTAQPVEGAGFYTVDQSGGGVKHKSVVALDVADQAALVSRGGAIVQSQTQLGRTLEVTMGPSPWLWHFDVLNYKDPAAIGEFKCQTRSWRMPLDGADVSATLEVL